MKNTGPADEFWQKGKMFLGIQRMAVQRDRGRERARRVGMLPAGPDSEFPHSDTRVPSDYRLNQELYRDIADA